MPDPDDDWLRRELEAMTPEELDNLYLRMARLKMGARMKGNAIHHIDGDPTNNSPDNLRVVDTRENSRGKPFRK